MVQDPLKDFSRPRKRVAFTIDDDTFEAPPVIPAQILLDFTVRFESMSKKNKGGEVSPAENLKIMSDLLELILIPASYQLFIKRLSDRENPIELSQLQDVIEWLLGQYGLRPTKSQDSFSNGPPNQETGTSWTGSTPDEELTSDSSLLTSS